jgi:hypothetical protein
MAKFSFSFDVVEQWTGTFEAANETEARIMLLEVIEQDTNLDDLPEYEERNFDLTTSIELRSLRELGI